MGITKITITMLHDPDGFVIQDATIPPADSRARAEGRSQLFVHIHTDEGTVGLGMAPGQRAIRDVIHQNLDGVLVGAWVWPQEDCFSGYCGHRYCAVGSQGQGA